MTMHWKAALPTDEEQDGAFVDEDGKAVNLDNAVFVDVSIEVDGTEATIADLSEKIQITVAAPKTTDDDGAETSVSYASMSIS